LIHSFICLFGKSAKHQEFEPSFTDMNETRKLQMSAQNAVLMQQAMASQQAQGMQMAAGQQQPAA
jgi:primosomal protein N''